MYLATQRLRFDRGVLFPMPADMARSQSLPNMDYSYQQASSHLQPGNEQVRLEQTLALLHEYGWAAASHENGVSLYDSVRTDAALAAAQEDGAEKILLLGGDLSGVQEFLYTIAADKAAKNLRGRSLYLQLLTDAVAHWILRETGMPLTNLLYSGGGRFYLIVPGRFSEVLDSWRRQLGAFLLNVHQGELYLALGGTSFSSQSPVDFPRLWREVNEHTNQDKRRRFAALAPSELEQVFAPRGHGGNTESACDVCGFMGDPREFAPADPDPEAGRRCHLCASFEELGRQLADARFICIQQGMPTLNPRGRVAWHQILRELGQSVWVEDDPGMQRLASTRQGMRVLAMGNIDLEPLRRDYPWHAFSLRPVVNEVPRYSAADLADPRLSAETEGLRVGNVKSFGAMSRQARGVRRWGVLRMDVDDLGDIFAYSLPGASLARISALSAALSRFFEGWVGEVCRTVNATQGKRLYSVYSGGDDLFLVGSWDVLPDIARQISADLAKYAAHNPLVHISAGLSLHANKYPLYQAAEDADEALERAKHVLGAPGRSGKNAFAFLDQTVQWPYANDLWNLVSTLDGLVGGDAPRLSRAILQTLQQLYIQYVQGAERHRNKQGQAQWFLGPWVWRGVYQLKRLEESIRHDDKAQAFIAQLRQHLTDGSDAPAWTGGRAIERAGLAARWVQLLIRRNKEERNGRD
jgi:CRISPR-associated protein Csm1